MNWFNVNQDGTFWHFYATEAEATAALKEGQDIIAYEGDPLQVKRFEAGQPVRKKDFDGLRIALRNNLPVFQKATKGNPIAFTLLTNALENYHTDDLHLGLQWLKDSLPEGDRMTEDEITTVNGMITDNGFDFTLH